MACIEKSEIDFTKEVLPLIKEGKNEKVISILHQYFDLSHLVDSSKVTLLHYAVEYGNEDVTKYLLGRGYAIDVQNSSGTTPLMIAVMRKHRNIIPILLEAGADIMMLNYQNKSALQMSCEEHRLFPSTRRLILRELPKRFSNSKEIAQKLIDVGCHLYQAAYLGNAEVLEYMLEKGFLIDSTHPTSKQTALHVAFLLEDVDSIKLLVNYGANADALDCTGGSPLFSIYQCNLEHTDKKRELLQILLNLKVSLMACTRKGYFQMASILTTGNFEIIRQLLQANIDFTAKDKRNERNVLNYLSINTNPKVVEELDRYVDEFDVNAVDKLGLNPLYLASLKANVDMIKFLLRHGATPNCAHNVHGYTPLYGAYSRIQKNDILNTNECIELLLQHNADPQFVVTEENEEKITVFDMPIETDRFNTLKPILAHLGVVDGLGLPITEIISTKIKSCHLLSKYFNRCQKLLKRKICGIALLKLLTANKKKMTRYSGNRKLVLKLIRLSYKQNLKSSHSYYYNTLKVRLSRGIQRRRFLNEVARVICKIFEDRVDKRHVIIGEIIDCLNDKSLQQLYQLSKMI